MDAPDLERELKGLRFAPPEPAVDRRILAAAPASSDATSRPAPVIWMLASLAAIALISVLALQWGKTPDQRPMTGTESNVTAHGIRANETSESSNHMAADEGASNSPDWGAIVRGVRCQVACNKSTYIPGERVLITITVENTLDTPAPIQIGQLLQWTRRNLWLGTGYERDFLRITRDGEAMTPDKELSAGLDDARRRENLTLRGHEARRHTIDISELWNLKTPGSYTLAVHIAELQSNTAAFTVALPPVDAWGPALPNGIRACVLPEQETWLPGEVPWVTYIVQNTGNRKSTGYLPASIHHDEPELHESRMHGIVVDNNPTLDGHPMRFLLSAPGLGELKTNVFLKDVSEIANIDYAQEGLEPGEIRCGSFPLIIFQWQYAARYRFQLDMGGGAMTNECILNIDAPADWQWGEPIDGIFTHIHTDKTVYHSGDDIALTLVRRDILQPEATYKNGLLQDPGGNGVLLLINDADVVIRRESGVLQPPLPGKTETRTAAIPIRRKQDARPPLPEGERLWGYWVHEIAVSRYWDLTAPGRYTIMVKNWGAPESNTWTFEVLPR